MGTLFKEEQVDSYGFGFGFGQVLEVSLKGSMEHIKRWAKSVQNHPASTIVFLGKVYCPSVIKRANRTILNISHVYLSFPLKQN